MYFGFYFLSNLIVCLLSGRPEIPNLTLSHDIVFEQEPWVDRPSKCDGEVGSPEGELVVELMINGSFVEYEGWWPLNATSKNTECGTHKTQPFVFYEETLQYLNYKKIRCAVKSKDAFVNETMLVSDVKMIYVVPSKLEQTKQFRCLGKPTLDSQ